MSQNVDARLMDAVIVAGSLYPAELVIGHSSFDWSVRIKTTGAVEISPAVSLDDAALEFWRAVERMGFVRRAGA